MSLIDDALRRAQAAQQAGPAGSGHRVPLPLPDPGRRRGRRILRLTGAGLGAAAIVVAGALVLRRSGGRGGEPNRHDPTPPARVSSEAAAVAQPTDVPPTPSPAAATRRREASEPPAPEEPASGKTLSTAPQSTAPTASRRTAPPRPAPAQAISPPWATPAKPKDLGIVPATRERTIRREPPESPNILPPAVVENASASPRIAGDERPRPVETPHEPSRTRTFAGTARVGNAKLQLEGIVFSEAHPTALINGRVVAPGSFVDGFTVIKIDPNWVELTDDNERIILTLK